MERGTPAGRVYSRMAACKSLEPMDALGRLFLMSGGSFRTNGFKVVVERVFGNSQKITDLFAGFTNEKRAFTIQILEEFHPVIAAHQRGGHTDDFLAFFKEYL